MTLRILFFMGLMMGAQSLLGQGGWSADGTERIYNNCIKQCTNDYPAMEQKYLSELCTCVTEQFQKKYPSKEDFTTAMEKDVTATKKTVTDISLDCSASLSLKYPESAEFLVANRNVAYKSYEKNGTSELAYPQKWKELYIQGCLDRAKNAKGLEQINVPQFCSCMADKIQVKYPNYRDYVVLEQKGLEALGASISEEVKTCLQDKIKK
jgi:hypothetical protein